MEWHNKALIAQGARPDAGKNGSALDPCLKIVRNLKPQYLNGSRKQRECTTYMQVARYHRIILQGQNIHLPANHWIIDMLFFNKTCSQRLEVSRRWGIVISSWETGYTGNGTNTGKECCGQYFPFLIGPAAVITFASTIPTRDLPSLQCL